jgi:hypothetical protein
MTLMVDYLALMAETAIDAPYQQAIGPNQEGTQ